MSSRSAYLKVVTATLKLSGLRTSREISLSIPVTNDKLYSLVMSMASVVALHSGLRLSAYDAA